MPLTSGSRLGLYEIVAPLGAGGMGEVYRARDTKLGREIALKILPEDLSANADRLLRFEREARTVAALNHPNIVTLHSMEEDRGVRFLTMELVDGQSLDRDLPTGGLPVTRVVELGISLADALTAAHERGVIHRDLKPGNVMVTREGRVKVLDFGLAKLNPVDAASSQSDVATMAAPASGVGSVVGTVPYMAPEQIRGETVDARSDLFALGIMLYELATGHRPFSGKSSIDISSAILRDTPTPVTRVRNDLPGDLERIIVRCLEKNPRERFQTALDISNELRGLRRTFERREATAPQKSTSGKVASIAVLPFANRSASADDEYFSDGLTDELINVLAKIRGLRVVARASAFQFKGRNEDLSVIGAKLNVATVLDGTVRKAGNRVRISVQLVKVVDSSTVWSESYDRTLDDIFAVQDDIAQSVVKELRTTLLGAADDSDASGEAKAEVANAARGRAVNPEAHRLYLLARHLQDRATREDVDKCIACLKEALALEPEFALAWAALSDAYFSQNASGWISPSEAHRLGLQASERSLALEPNLPDGHSALSRVYLQVRDWPRTEASLRRALELEPNSPRALGRMGMLATNLGRAEEGIGYCRRALEHDPLSQSAWFWLGAAASTANRPVEAEHALRRCLELAPGRPAGHSLLAWTLMQQGQAEEALAEAQRETVNFWRFHMLAILHHMLGQHEPSDAALHDLKSIGADDAAFQIAEVHGARGETDDAFAWLERAFQQNDGGLGELKRSRSFGSLQQDPRWSAFLAKVGYES